ncbi:cupin domain-containing protein [Pontibacter chitinilyticus]|uniref:cupin domain-containing protein n=1 Tax=Pontibacter chitinilyticus TaxID=2674989 RepID=UPI00321C10B0
MQTVVTLPPKANRKTAGLSLLFYPVGVYRIWKTRTRLWIRLLYTLVGLPVFLLVFSFLAITGFALPLPDLDLSMGYRNDRTVINSMDNYATTFLKSGSETDGAYELVRVELGPQGGNDWHYHKTFDEQFTVEEGEVTIGLDGKEIRLKKGESATAYKTHLHFFQNKTATKAVLRVKVTPARGLEKSIRIAYGLGNTGQWEKDGFAKNPWHLFLVMGYSESYLPGMPAFIEEPLIKSLAKIGQWKGEDKALQVFIR